MSNEPNVVELSVGKGFSLVTEAVVVDEFMNSFSIFVVSGLKVEPIVVESELPESVAIELLLDSVVEGDAVVVI